MIQLLPFTIEDSLELISAIKDKRMLLQFAGPAYHFPLTKEQLEVDLKNENRFMFRVFDETEQKVIGHAQIFLKENTFLLGRILIWDENNRGKGYGKKIVQNLLQYGFSHFNRETAELNVYDWNTGAIECYKKVGFEIDPDVLSEVSIDNELWLSVNMKISKNTFQSLQQ
ncbi:Protein N-acetyltransferase, RimJ/RimL family [Chryseobacterium oranimense]|uniref:Protein N-acetyltransferase, RimJ/RimL family n=1 Tax=Chryseobacterium oranimense TaxID=421058 RepID=A0A1M5JZH1_9FLAO|nr:GNAT family protein [Chryseobacterium oranimense]SHG45934.1 Protein N-acetyltransferase, RimJ/RimL family [Chryseobacterium oranimense]